MSRDSLSPSRAVRGSGRQGPLAGGFGHVSTRGSHAKYRAADRTVIVPLHSSLAPGTLKSILRQADWTIDTLLGHM
ncbi:type II toxin-antitoxin system HicA family toxin [Streptomyces sp. NPDC093085]|uniref:type II toxin-antitoxin system HicA family toxin n=1 Tax=Streptomyces sp. NPDC093085 TaxID=3155068 RepID=UPI00341F9463